MPLTINLAADLGDDFHLRGLGIDAYLAGSARVRMVGNGDPRVNGTIRVASGQYAAYGQKLTIDRGVLTFNGRYDNPSLDVLAVRKQPEGTQLSETNVEAGVLDRARAFGMVTMPGVFTATEAFRALAAGASALKFFPASVLGPKGIAALRAVLPSDTVIAAVGGVSEKDFVDYAKAGISTFGLGSSLYSPGMDVALLRGRAAAAVEAWDAVFAGHAE